MHFAATLLILFESFLTKLMKRHRHFDRHRTGVACKIAYKGAGLQFFEN